ncbi:MAG TPA: MFS transporter [Symbiobacteriaceae bacterium]|nr:MFS transporter [Symbiobacteriaceae bacterium]
MNNERLWGRNFISLSLSSFFTFLSYYTLGATLPVYAVAKFQAGKPQVGLILTAFALSALASRPVAGPWMKRFGERRALVTAVTGVFAVTSLYLVVGDFRFLLALRVVHGLSLGIATSAAATMAAHLVPKSRTGEGLGYFGMFQSTAMVLGPFVGLTLIQFLPFSVLFACCALFALFSLVSGVLVQVPAAGPAQAPSAAAGPQAKPAMGLSTLLEPAAIPVALCGFLMAFAYGGISAFASVYGNALGLTKITSYFFAVYALMVVLPRPWFGRLFDRVGANAVIYPGIVLFAAGLFLLSHARTGFSYLGAAGVIGTGWGALSSFQALIVKAAPADRRGYATSTWYFFIDAGIASGSLLLGMVAGRSDYATAYLVSSAVVAFMVPLFFLVHHRPAAIRKAALTAQAAAEGA